MDWELKMPTWDLAELGASVETNMNSIVNPSSGVLDCSVDLKLGGLGEFSQGQKWKDNQRVLSASSSSSKRARAQGNSSQNVACLVDGCKSDLTNCRDYHKRHKVCEVHSKTPIVLVGGQEQRFCQQCSRFHMLVEFDEVKRSCRKRLDGHNRRRRKPQPDTINADSLSANHQGNRFSSYPQIFTSATPDSTWPVIIKTENDSLFSHHPYTHNHFSASFTRNFKHGSNNKHFPFLQDSDLSIRRPLLKTIISSAESSTTTNNNNNKIFTSSSNITQVIDSDCALSLLSSPPPLLGQIVSSPLISYGPGLGLGRFSGSGHVPGTGFSCDNVEGGAVLIPDGSVVPEQSCHGLFGEGSSDGGSHALPYSWQ